VCYECMQYVGSVFLEELVTSHGSKQVILEPFFNTVKADAHMPCHFPAMPCHYEFRLCLSPFDLHSAATFDLYLSITRPEMACGRPAHIRLLLATTQSSRKLLSAVYQVVKL
jgi:hypothetical protein